MLRGGIAGSDSPAHSLRAATCPDGCSPFSDNTNDSCDNTLRDEGICSEVFSRERQIPASEGRPVSVFQGMDLFGWV